MAAKQVRNRGLGRGLSALMADVKESETTPSARSETLDRPIPIEKINPNPDQPRRRFDQAALDELAASIAEKGIIQPLILRVDPNKSDKYQIVAGERRWRAAQQAQLHEVPAIVREFTDLEVLEVAIVENVQRADLNPVDEANGYRQLVDEFGHTQDQVATALGKSRSHIANTMRLLSLPDPVLEYLQNGKLSAGHARALVGRNDAAALAAEIIKKRLSVRQTEALVRAASQAKPNAIKTPKAGKDADTLQIESELGAHLKMKVSIEHAEGQESGKVTLHYRTLEQLDDLLRHLSRD